MGEGTRLEETRPTGHGRARGLVSSRRSGARVAARSYEVPEDLRDLVASIWVGSWELSGQEPHETRLLGDPCVHLVFEESVAAREARVVGVWTTLWRRKLEGRGRVFGVKMRPGAACALLPGEAHRWTDRVTPWGEGPGEDPGLTERVLSASRDEDAFEALASWARSRRALASNLEATALAVRLADRIMTEPALGSVAALASSEGVGVRTLQRLFRSHVGASPKWALMRRRVQEAALRMERGEAGDLAALALDLGYADQAHLTRDFKAMTGMSPRAFTSHVWE